MKHNVVQSPFIFFVLPQQLIYMSNYQPVGFRGGVQERKKRDKYHRIPLKTKLIFYHKVIQQQADIDEIASRLNIKKSTAKTLIRNYKTYPEEKNPAFMHQLLQKFQGKSPPQKRCSYQVIEQTSDLVAGSCRADSDRNETDLAFPKIEIISSFMGQQSQ